MPPAGPDGSGPPITTAEQLKLSPSPEDGVTTVKFQPGRMPQLLVSAGWDCFVRLYDTANNGYMRACYQHSTPVLCACFTEAQRCVSGSANGDIKSYDVVSGTTMTLGSCFRAASCIHHSASMNVTFTGSWDSNVRIWDSRSPGAPELQGASSIHKQPSAVCTMDSVRHQLVVGTAQRHVLIWDIRQMASPVEQRESNLRYQTRCIRCFPNGQGFVLSSIEGRVAVEMFDPAPEVQKKKYAFKCHRVKEGEKEVIYPVIAITFHPEYNTFATGGCDGFVNIWDGFNRKRLAQLNKFHTSIASLDFSEDGTQLAIATAYMFDRGELENQPESAIFVRSILDHEVKPKQPAAKSAV